MAAIAIGVASCISFDSYIKPQLDKSADAKARSCISFDSYIKPQPSPSTIIPFICCISFDSYIKPQQYRYWQQKISGCISFDSYIKPQPIEYNILIHNIYQSLLLIRNGVQDIISIAKVLKKLQLNRFADNFFRYFTLINTYWLTPEVIDISILLICYT